MSLHVLTPGRMEYLDACRLQEELVARRRENAVGDTLILLEHEPVVTVGRAGEALSSILCTATGTIPVVSVARGGQATYHGPGQLVGYPIIDLRGWKQDLHWYIRTLEELLICALARLEVAAGRQEGLTGVWVGERKIASIGVGVRGWVTWHGFALNVETDLSGFAAITPCGLPAETMINLRETGCTADLQAVSDVVRHVFEDFFKKQENICETGNHSTGLNH